MFKLCYYDAIMLPLNVYYAAINLSCYYADAIKDMLACTCYHVIDVMLQFNVYYAIIMLLLILKVYYAAIMFLF